MRHTLHKGSVRAKPFRVLDRWMRETATLLQGFNYYAPDFRPFDELEVPGTSVLLGAAGSAGYYPIAEYDIRKINKSDRRTKRDGRADLWFIAGAESFSFEMKRAWNASSEKQLKYCMQLAVDDASEIPEDESDFSFGVVIAPVFQGTDVDEYKKFKGSEFTFSIDYGEESIVFFFFARPKK